MLNCGELMLECLPLVTVLASDTAGDKEQVSNKVTFLLVHLRSTKTLIYKHLQGECVCLHQ